jgi:hypothetical protein
MYPRFLYDEIREGGPWRGWWGWWGVKFGIFHKLKGINGLGRELEMWGSSD